MKVFITGIKSFLGSHLAQRLAASGHEVHGSARQSTPDERIQAYRLGEPVPPAFFQGCQVLIHCAWDIKNPEATDNINATRLLVEAGRAQGIARQILISSLSARSGAPTRYGADKYAAEALFNLSGNDLVLRPGLIVGDGGLFRQTFDFLRDHSWIPMIDGGKFPMPLVGIAELSLCVEKALTLQATGNAPLKLFHKHLPSQRACLEDISRLKHWNRHFVWLPSRLLMPCLSLFELLHLRLPITRANVVAALSNQFTPEESDLNRLLGQEADYEALIQSLRELH